MAAANRLATCSDFELTKNRHFSLFSEANSAATTDVELKLMTELSVVNERAAGWRSPRDRRRKNDIDKQEMEGKMWNVIKSIFRDNSSYVQKLNIDQNCVPHSSRIGRNNGIKVINDMTSSGWHSSAVDCLLNYLVCNTKDFRLVIVFCENEPSDTDDFDLFLDFHFIWRGTGFVCIVEESTNGYMFMKDLVLVEIPTKRDCFVVSEKRRDLCVVMDGEHVQLETMKADRFITVWHYCGNENDPTSRHRDSQRILTVFGFKLKSIDSDVTRCLGATNPTSVALFKADIPDHGNVLKTKADYRFFYHSSVHECSTFESTQFENHFLAVKDSDDESVSPYLYLKKITEDKEYDEDILFQVMDCPKDE